MPSFSWAANVGGNWNTGTVWTPISVPNIATADVMIDAAATLACYTVTIAPGESETLDSSCTNDTNNRVRSYTRDNHLDIKLDGMLVFAVSLARAFGGSLQTHVHERRGANAAIVNGGTLNAFIEVEGTLPFTGTNSVYISNEFEVLAGTVTTAAPIGKVTGDSLTDGMFDVTGPGSVIDLGGAPAGQIVNTVVQNYGTIAGSIRFLRR